MHIVIPAFLLCCQMWQSIHNNYCTCWSIAVARCFGFITLHPGTFAINATHRSHWELPGMYCCSYWERWITKRKTYIHSSNQELWECSTVVIRVGKIPGEMCTCLTIDINMLCNYTTCLRVGLMHEKLVQHCIFNGMCGYLPPPLDLVYLLHVRKLNWSFWKQLIQQLFESMNNHSW